MRLRSQTAALAVLFIALAVVFLLVGDAGVSTGVFLPAPTLTHTPTIAPTATPGPEPGAANWTETGAGQWAYAGPSGVAARINHDTINLDEFITGTGLTPPAADAPYPLLDVLGQLFTSLEGQASGVGLTWEPGAFSGPIIEIIGEVPVALMQARVQPQTRPDGQQFLGLDLVQALIDRGEGEVVFVQYVLQGPPDDVAFGDFRAWLGAHAADLAGQAAAEEDGEGAGAAEGEATPGAPEAQPTDAAEEGAGN